MTETGKLASAARDGDASAFSKLYSQCYKELYRYAYFCLGSAEDAEDTVMEAVADAFQGMHGLRDPERFKSWIFRILHNKVKRQKKKRFINRPEELDDDQVDPGSGDLFEQVENRDMLLALSELTFEEREIVLLAVVANYPSKDIAEILKMNANTVRSKQQRALLKLRALLESGKEGRHELS